MAKRKKKSHGHARRRRSHRMGAVNLAGVGMKVVGVAAAAFLDNIGRKNLPSLNQKVVGIAEIAAGYFVPKLIKSRSPLIEGVGDGLIAVGTINLMKSFSVISGVGAVPNRVPLRRAAISPGQPAIGNAGRPFLSQNVGSLARSPEMQMMGALFAED